MGEPLDDVNLAVWVMEASEEGRNKYGLEYWSDRMEITEYSFHSVSLRCTFS